MRNGFEGREVRLRPVRTGIALSLLVFASQTQSSARAQEDGPQHLRYERATALPPGTQGAVCVVLDALAFAHAASRSGNDLRVFREQSGTQYEVPFALTESEATPGDAQSAKAVNVHAAAGHLSFDLQMPQQPYSRIDLQLAAKDFLGVARVSASTQMGHPPRPLGTFALFDLSAQHLGRSTAFVLEETSQPMLHVELQIWTPAHAVYTGLTASMVQGASVPPSREAQTLYTTVARTTQITVRGGVAVATLPLAAHVPLEQVTVELDHGYRGSFLSGVTVSERTADAKDATVADSVSGTMSRIELPLYLDANPDAAIYRNLSMPAVLATNLRSAATVEVAIEDAGGAVPVRAVRLEMRQRMVCFDAAAADAYTVRYGDDGLQAPVYINNAVPYRPGMKPVVAVLGPELVNPAFASRSRSVHNGRPDIFWIALLVFVTLLGALARQAVRRAGKKV